MIRTGLYPGTFDPITNGHLDIVSRAVKLVDRLVIGVAINRDKGPTFSLEERVAIVREETQRFAGRAEIVVQPFETLLMQFAQEVGADGVTVNAVCPGIILTEMGRNNLGSDEAIRHWEGVTALKRLGQPEDVVGAVYFFASDLASFVTGQALNVDGGIYYH